jgi:DUF4097 and DUF4098 domain-containing protein YvlB
MREIFDTPGPVTVDLQVAIGDIEVIVEDGPTTTVEISGYEKDEAPLVTCDQIGGGYRVSIEHKPKKFWGFRITFGDGLTIRLTVPEATTIDGSSASAELEATGTMAALSFRTGSGDLAFHDVTGDVQLTSASGDVEGRSVGGHLAFKGASGDIEIGAVAGGATVRSASGDISIGRLDGTALVTVGSGDVELRQVGPGSVNARAISGDVHVGVREGLGVWLDVSSTSGDVHSTLDAARRADADHDVPELELTLNTVSGDIDVTRVPTKVR